MVSGTCNYEVAFRHVSRFAILKKHFKVVFCASVISLNSKAFNSTE